nr:hypothetical protein [Xanthomonas phaseoli pv. phaseoli]MDM4806158.1 hypothetical protein [Xanthomonas phaseoli pv. phaseoli]MDM4810169.1 hypothetical protein [Xanthomonas phaseoli pv. phaseoli]
LHGTSSGKGTRKFHFWRLLMGGGITEQMQATAGNQPELRIAASADAEYAVMASVLAAAKNAQVQRIAFVQ